MNTADWIDSILKSNRVAAIPIMTHPGIEILGYRVLDAVTDGQIHFEAIRALNERFPQAAACTVIMDLSVEAEAFGAKLHFAETYRPDVSRRIRISVPGNPVRQLNLLPYGFRTAHVERYDSVEVRNGCLTIQLEKNALLRRCIGAFGFYHVNEWIYSVSFPAASRAVSLKVCLPFGRRSRSKR